MAPVGEDGAPAAPGAAAAGTGPAADEDEGKLGGGGSSYVPPHLRNRGGATGEKMSGGGKYERDDLATLRVTNVGAGPLNLLFIYFLCPPGARNTYLRIEVTSTNENRCPSLRRNKIFVRSSSGTGALLGYSLPKIGRQEGPKALLSSASQTEQMRNELATRSMDVSSTAPWYSN